MILSSRLLLALGFRRDLSSLRYASFFGLAASVVKGLLVDLAATDPAVTVVILMSLGLVMVDGGYWYIQHRRAEEKNAVPEP